MSRFPVALVLLLVVGMAANTLSVEAGRGFHVSIHGDDALAGTANQPFRSLNRARDAIREMRDSDGQLADGVTVIVHGGTYWLPEPFELGSNDGGTAAAPVIYRAADGEALWLSGGMPLKLANFRLLTDQVILQRLPAERRGQVLAYRFTAEQAARFVPPGGPSEASVPAMNSSQVAGGYLWRDGPTTITRRLAKSSNRHTKRARRLNSNIQKLIWLTSRDAENVAYPF